VSILECIPERVCAKLTLAAILATASCCDCSAWYRHAVGKTIGRCASWRRLRVGLAGAAIFSAKLATAALLAAAFAPASAIAQATTPEAVKEAADKLTAELAKLTTTTHALRESLANLRAAMLKAELKGPIDALTDRVPEMQKLLDTINAVNPPITPLPSLILSIDALITSLEKIVVAEPTTAATRSARSLGADLFKDGLNPNFAPLVGAADSLFLEKRMEKLEDANPLLFARRYADGLAKLMTVVKAQPRLDDPLKTSIAKLVTAVDDFKGLIGGPRIHVVAATYGDLTTWARRQDKRGRLCDATAAVRTSCEDKPQCNIGTEFNALCGDVATHADPFDKGLVVVFRCLEDGDRVAPQALPTISFNADRDAYSIRLRTPAEQFSCVGEPKFEEDVDAYGVRRK
jgi:hypothetical protein